jgi:hypothetical protein
LTAVPRPVLGDVNVEDKHERTVVVQLDGTEPFATGYYRRGAEVRFQPQTLRLIWKGIPPQLYVVSIAGPELTKSGAVHGSGRADGHSYLRRTWVPETAPDGRVLRLSGCALDDDTPDWVHELIAQYTPDWSGLGWNDESRTPEENEKTIAALLKAADEWEARS